MGATQNDSLDQIRQDMFSNRRPSFNSEHFENIDHIAIKLFEESIGFISPGSIDRMGGFMRDNILRVSAGQLREYRSAGDSLRKRLNKRCQKGGQG